MLVLCFGLVPTRGQSIETYLHDNAVRVAGPQSLSDSVHALLSPFQMIMIGEMHGSNEPAALVTGLAQLLADKGDSVQVGLEIPAELMPEFLSEGTDSSVLSSRFFSHPPYFDGRQSKAWTDLITTLNGHSRIRLFFFDMNQADGSSAERDSLMYLKIKAQYLARPHWKLLTLSGNWHNRISGDPCMATYLLKDPALGLTGKLCSLNHYYLSGSCRANFGNGLEERQLDRPASAYDTSLGFDQYLLLMKPTSTYPYSGFYYTRHITPALVATK